MKNITITELYQKVEEQKNIALSTPIYIFGSDAAISAIEPCTSQFQNVLNNENLFSINMDDKAKVEKTLAGAINRTLAFYIYKSSQSFHETFITESLMPSLEIYPHIDLYCIDLCLAKMAEVNQIQEFNIKKYPVVLMFRAGHFIDKVNVDLNKAAGTDPLELIKAEQMKKYSETPQLNPDGTKIDAEKEAFEQRLREKEIEAKKREEEERRKHILEVKKKIAQDKLERRKKYGKL